MVIQYESQSIFRLGKFNSVSEYDNTPGEYDIIESSVNCLDKFYCSYI
jgi:hypothetical protein